MTTVFADTSFYAAFLSHRDLHHANAVTLAAANPATIVTTEFVIIELVNSFSRSSSRATVIEFIRSLRGDGDTMIVPATSELLQRGFELYSHRPDKEWSLTDCISFVVMEEYGITEALTSDGDFEQAGFTKLL